MKKGRYMITIELAGVPVRVYLRHQRNRNFLEDYRSPKEPLFSVEASDQDLADIQESLDLMAETEGEEKRQYSEVFLENNAIHSLLAENLIRYHALLLHGSALCMDGQAYIFVAPSGTGKSTHARLWRQTFGGRVWMINDDKPLLRLENGRVMVYGTPWNGKHRLGRNASAPLRAVAKLTRDETNHIELLDPSDAFPVIIRQAIRPKDISLMSDVIIMEKQITNLVKFYSLGCNMEQEAALVSYRKMSGNGEDPEEVQ